MVPSAIERVEVGGGFALGGRRLRPCPSRSQRLQAFLLLQRQSRAGPGAEF